jgi:PAS domain S-box-containing protein
MITRTFPGLIITFLLLSHSVLIFSQDIAGTNEKDKTQQIVRVGIRSFSGIDATESKWSATMDYLNMAVEDYVFEMIPVVGFEDMREIVKNKEVDFVLTNPAAYIYLEVKFGVTRIATLNNNRFEGGLRDFAAVLFTLSNGNKINHWKDIQGKSIMGVDPEAFGGWRMAYYEMLERGLDPFQICSEVLFSPDETQEGVVYSVLSGKADIGTVRTGILESMINKQLINPDLIKIIDPKLNQLDLMHSTEFYPEWPFSKLKHSSESLAVEVLTALLHIKSEDRAAIAGGYTGWTIPLDYSKVHNLLRTLKAPPYDNQEEITFQDIWGNYWKWIVTVLIFLIAAFNAVIIIISLNRNLRSKTNDLEQIAITLEERVKQRTKALENESLQLSESKNALQTSEEKFKTLVTQSEEIFYLSDIDGKVLLFEGKGLSKMGLKPEQLVGETVYNLYKDYPYILDSMRKAFSGETITMEVKIERDYFKSLYTPYRNEIDEIIGIMGFSVNITAQKESEEKIYKYKNHLEELVEDRTVKLEEINDKLIKSQQAMRYLVEDINDSRENLKESNLKLIRSYKDLESFSYSVSHDLRAPLRAILGFTSKLQKQIGESAETETNRLMKVISENAINMQNLITSLLNFSRVASSNFVVVPVNMNNLVSSVFGNYTEIFKKNSIKSEILSLPDTTASYSMIRQVFINLLDNAIKFSRSKDKPCITVGYLEMEEGSGQNLNPVMGLYSFLPFLMGKRISE